MRIFARTAALLLGLGLAWRAVAHADTDPRVAGAHAPRVVAARTNTELLVASARAVATKLANVVPLPAGARVALQPEGHEAVDTDVSEALLLAFNARGFTCMLLPAPPAADTTAAAVPPPDTSAAKPGTGPGAKEAYLKLQEERKAQQALADSLARLAAARGGAGPSGGAAPALPPGVPLLTYRVAEGRVDYARLFRSGIFGSERIERRATTRVTLKLHAPGDDAVRWSTSADTTIADVVARAELAALEDRMRPETRPVPPQSNLKKVVEPALVVALIAGLVALFYQNRP